MAEDLITEGVQERHTLESIGMGTEVEDIMKTIEMSSDLFAEPMLHFRELRQGHNSPLHVLPFSGVFIIRPSSVAWGAFALTSLSMGLDGHTSARS
ncbi:hypothetical protein BDV34DRAFT_217393 [Aspergillus parasiticus]|uniref:Uncharacterized protein n=1 Tax=Aspergillus parasiticus TaxID=5067 RepID=A0A5N6D4L3_ASPPA|nr:hypothetical protein BDV34DRAFT_217393 [Aspergillus parasiticus]